MLLLRCRCCAIFGSPRLKWGGVLTSLYSSPQAAKRLLEQYNAKPVSIMARYACAYSTIKKRDWWDISICGGPIVEQATHFVDLLRYFGGEIAHESIKAVAAGPSLPLSDMADAPNAEHTVSSPFKARNLLCNFPLRH